MRLQVKGKNVEVAPSVREYAERKLAKLERQLAAQTQVEISSPSSAIRRLRTRALPMARSSEGSDAAGERVVA